MLLDEVQDLRFMQPVSHKKLLGSAKREQISKDNIGLNSRFNNYTNKPSKLV